MKTSTRNHPSYQRLRDFAQPYSSRPRLDDLPSLIEWRRTHRPRTGSRWCFRATWTPRAARWTEIEREIRRAQHDPKFRRALLAGQARRHRALSQAPASTQRVAAWCSAREAHAVRGTSINVALERRAKQLPAKSAVVPYLAVGEADAARHGVRVVRRGADWGVQPTRLESRYEHEAGETEWKNGNPVAYTRATNTTYVRSFAIAREDRALIAYGPHDYSLLAPAGCGWDVDANGLRLYLLDSPRDDYHPDAADCWAARDNECADLLAVLRANQARRLETAARAAAERADAQGVWISVADSTRAGNCLAGTLIWAARHNLDPRRHYQAAEVLDIGVANNEPGRVRLAITAAVHRHRREIEAGVCSLADHA